MPYFLNCRLLAPLWSAIFVPIFTFALFLLATARRTIFVTVYGVPARVMVGRFYIHAAMGSIRVVR